MKTIKYLILLAVITFTVLSCAKMPVYKPLPAVNNQGKVPELRFYDKESKIKYDVFKNDNNICVYMITSDYYAQVKILKLGTTLWIDPNNKKKKMTGIEFPVKGSMKRPSKSSGGSMNPGMDRYAGSQKFSQLYTMFELSSKNNILIGFDGKGSKKEINPDMGNSDVFAKISFDESNRLIYKAVIPVKYIHINDDAESKEFSIGIESGHIDMSSNAMGKGNRPGGGGGGRGGGMGGGGGMKMGGGGASPYSVLSEPVKVWFSVSLEDL